MGINIRIEHRLKLSIEESEEPEGHLHRLRGLLNIANCRGANNLPVRRLL